MSEACMNTLPIMPQGALTMMTSQSISPPEKKCGTILIVDDTLPNLKLLSFILTERGYTVRGASDGASALMIAQSKPPDVILLDIRMPGMNGMEVCFHLKADDRTRSIPVIFISALDDVRDKVEGFAAGGVDYITKPFQPEEVLARVDTHLSLSKLQNRLRELVEERTAELAHTVVVLEEEVAERKRTEIELIAAKERAEQSDRLKDAFIANVSHEIRTPLNIMIGYMNILLEEYGENGPPELGTFYESIQRGGRRLLRTVELILSISRMQVGDIHMRRDWYDLRDIVRRLVDDFGMRAQEQHLSLTFTNDVGSAWIECDKYCIEQVLGNLIENAVKFTSEGGIELRLYSNSAAELCLDVKDTGTGIAPEYIPRIFEPYTQEDIGCARRYEGLGLGLALVKKYLALHHADISVESRKNIGSTFTINFHTQCLNMIPRTDASILSQNTTGANPDEKCARLRKRSVLVVEDDPQSIDYMKALLQGHLTVHLASNATAAWEALQDREIDLVLMDISLSDGKDGLTLTREIRQDSMLGGIPVIAVTAHAFPRDRENALEAGCTDYLAKPFQKQSLLELIAKYLKT